MIHLPRALKQDDFQQFGSMAFCIFSNFCWHYLKKKKTSQAHCQGISKVQKVIGHTTKNITCIYRYYQDYLKYINFITQFLSLNMLMLRSCNHFFFTWALLATYLFTHVVYDLYVFRVGQESWRVHSDVVMKSWHHV